MILAAVLLVAGFAWGAWSAATHGFPHDLVQSIRGSAVRLVRGSGGATAGTRWQPLRFEGDEDGLTDEQREELDRLLTLGYLTGSRLAGPFAGVTAHDPDVASAGLNLFVSGHAPEAALIDMDGVVLHSWSLDYRDAWPDEEIGDDDPNTQFWRRAHLDPNGDLYAIFQWRGLVKLDRDSRLLWAYPGDCFNDLFVTDDGTVYVLTNENRLVPRIDEREPVSENFLVVLAPDGTVRKKISLLEAIERSPYAPLLERGPGSGDIIHGNTVQLLGGELLDLAPAFRKGNVLTSFRTLDAIAVIDLDEEAVVWALTGRWRMQHEPALLPGGTLLVFNNWAGPEASEVIEIDPITQETLWSYVGSEERPFYSKKAGSCQRLPNGNTLIVESDGGRAFEVAPDGDTAWEFINPHRAGEDGELIATLFDLVRLPPEFPLDWLEEDE